MYHEGLMGERKEGGGEGEVVGGRSLSPPPSHRVTWPYRKLIGSHARVLELPTSCTPLVLLKPLSPLLPLPLSMLELLDGKQVPPLPLRPTHQGFPQH